MGSHATLSQAGLHLNDKLSVRELANKIIELLFVYRRVNNRDENKCSGHCPTCANPHLTQVINAISARKPIKLILPAFPGKSPNPEKVLGYLPDLGETLALKNLESLCQQIKAIYSPGAKLIICSDGRVFSDVVGMDESHISDYQVALDKLIKDLSLQHLFTFNLDDCYPDSDYLTMREELMKQFSYPLDTLKQRVKNGAHANATLDELDANRMYCGITRFLFEDAMHKGQSMSRTAIQNQAKKKAYEVIQRSNAWSELLKSVFPTAVRLSIHPQNCGAKKLGICLIGEEGWITPWHGVVVKTVSGYQLMKRWQAEKLNATLNKYTNGRPSHYQLSLLESVSADEEISYAR